MQLVKVKKKVHKYWVKVVNTRGLCHSMADTHKVKGSAVVSAPGENLECEISDQTGSVDRYGDVSERKEESHDVDRANVSSTQSASLNFFPADG